MCLGTVAILEREKCIPESKGIYSTFCLSAQPCLFYRGTSKMTKSLSGEYLNHWNRL